MSHCVHPFCSSVCVRSEQTNRGRHCRSAPPHLEQPGQYARLLFADFRSIFKTKLLARTTGKWLDYNRPEGIFKCRACCLRLASKGTVVPACCRVRPGFSLSYLKSHDQWSSLSVTYLFLCHLCPTLPLLSPLAGVSQFLNIYLGGSNRWSRMSGSSLFLQLLVI